MFCSMILKELFLYILWDCHVTLFPNGQVIIFTFVDNVYPQAEEAWNYWVMLRKSQAYSAHFLPQIHLLISPYCCNPNGGYCRMCLLKRG